MEPSIDILFPRHRKVSTTASLIFLQVLLALCRAHLMNISDTEAIYYELQIFHRGLYKFYIIKIQQMSDQALEILGFDVGLSAIGQSPWCSKSRGDFPPQNSRSK